MDTAAAKKRCEAATEGPWIAELDYVAAFIPGKRPNGEIIGRWQTSISGLLSDEQRQANAEFAAHARSDLPAALEALEEAQGALKVIGDMHRSDGPNQFSLCIDVARAARDAILRGSKEGNDG